MRAKSGRGTAWGQEAPTVINDTARVAPQIFFACGGRLLIRIDPSHAQQSPPQHPPLPILVALLERNLQAKQFSQIASSSNKRMSRKPVYAGPL